MISDCNIINTELNHDLNPPTTQKLHKNPEFLKATRKLTPCDDMNGTGATQKSENFSEWFKDDYNYFSSIVSCKLKESAPEINISPNMLFEAISNAGGGPIPMYDTSNGGIFTGRWRANTVGGKMPLIVRRFNQVGKGGSNFEDKNILKIFDNCSKQGNELHAFFIVDTGDKFLKVLSQGIMNIDREEGFVEPEYHFHQLHSGTTLGDSASKTKPHAPIYDKLQRNKSDASLPNLYSWMFLKSIKVGRGDSQISSDDFKTAYEIDIKYLTYPPYTMQNWKYHENFRYDYNTTDPHKDNNKPNVIAWLNKLAIKNMKRGVISEDLKHNISLNLQKKRSGDALQYLFAKNLADMIDDANNIQLVKPSVLGTPGPHWLRQERDINFYKKNTFFLTGDWPAAAAALNHGVNTIMFYKSTDKNKTCFLSFAFIEAELEPETPMLSHTPKKDTAKEKKTKKRKKKRKKTKNKKKTK